MNIKQIVLDMRKTKKLQSTTSPDVIRATLIQQLIYKKADMIAQGTKLVGVQQFPQLDVKYDFPSDMVVDYPVAEGARGDKSKTTWTTFYMTMEKAEGSFMITDEAVMRQLEKLQYETGVRKLAEALAMRKDTNIIDTIHKGAHTTSIAASASWPTAAATSIAKDLAKAIGEAVGAKGVQPEEIKNMALVVPIRAWTPLLQLTEVENIRTQLADYIKSSYGLSIHPTKNTTLVDGGYGLVLIKGPDTAIHGTAIAPAKVPLVEVKRETGVGLEYTVRQFFNTRVVPDSTLVSTSHRIIRIAGVTG